MSTWSAGWVPLRRGTARFILSAVIAGSVLVSRPGESASPPPEVNTFSIVAADTVQGEWGVAVASRFLAVGSVVPWARAGVGAVATQASANTTFGPHGLALLERGHSAQETLTMLLQADPQSDLRQVGIVDARGRAVFFTGDRCREWAGGVRGPGFTVQGNFLAGPEVVDLMAKAFQETEGSLADRLLAALAAGDNAGGDSRGKQSAAILVVKTGGGYLGGNDHLVDLRVDDAKDPVTELRRLYKIHAATVLPAVHMRLGDEALSVGDRVTADREYGRVIRLYREALRDSPDNAKLLNGLAWFYVKHRVNLDEAGQLAERARKLSPRSWEVVDTLAEIQFARGNPSRAREFAEQALTLDPKNTYLKSQVDRFGSAAREAERR